MSFAYTPAKMALATGALALDTADIRVLLVMSNTTADTEQDAATIGGFTTLDEYDGAAYVRKAFAGETVTEDDPNNRAEFTADPVTWTALGVGTRQAVGMVIYLFVTNDADSLPIAYVDTGGFPFDGNGLDVLLTPNAEGLIQLT
jgi:hypothetical protein